MCIKVSIFNHNDGDNHHNNNRHNSGTKNHCRNVQQQQQCRTEPSTPPLVRRQLQHGHCRTARQRRSPPQSTASAGVEPGTWVDEAAAEALDAVVQEAADGVRPPESDNPR